MAQSKLVNKYCSISNASKLKVLSALTEDRSMTSIARENNVSINTVQRMLGNCLHRLICLDGDNHQIVQILRTCYKKTLLKYFGRFSPQARANVQVFLKTGNIQELKSLINSKDSIGTLMHKTLFTFKHNLKTALNGAALTYSNGCLEGFNRKIKQIERTAYSYSNYVSLLTRIRLEENKVKEKEPSNFFFVA